MAAAIEYYGDRDATEMVRFLRTFDRFFDCLNTRHLKEGLRKRKPDLFFMHMFIQQMSNSRYNSMSMHTFTSCPKQSIKCFLCTVVGGRSLGISE